jgi:hypothetical protein
MRSIGILVLIFGILAVAAPGLRGDFPFLDQFADPTLWIIGGSLLVLGCVIIALTRRDD